MEREMASLRVLTTRLPTSLLVGLERERFTKSEREGRRVSLRRVVQVALEEYLARVHAGPLAKTQGLSSPPAPPSEASLREEDPS